MIKTIAPMVMLAALHLAPAAAMAEDYELTVHNQTSSDIVALHASPAKVIGFKTVRSGHNKSVIVSSGDCVVDLRFSFRDTEQMNADDFDLCTSDQIRITEQY